MQEFNHAQLRRALTANLGQHLLPEVAARIEAFACTNPAPVPETPGGDVINDQSPELYAFANEALSSTYSPLTSRILARVTHGRIRAVVVYSDLRKWSVEMSIASDGTTGWLNRNLLRAAFRYPFHQLGLRRVTARVEHDNARALHLDRNLGFRDEGVQREQFGDSDAVMLGMLKSECGWL